MTRKTIKRDYGKPRVIIIFAAHEPPIGGQAQGSRTRSMVHWLSLHDLTHRTPKRQPFAPVPGPNTRRV